MATEYKVFDESRGDRAPVFMHDTARPFVVVAYKTGSSYRRSSIRIDCEGRYSTMKSARGRIRFLESR